MGKETKTSFLEFLEATCPGDDAHDGCFEPHKPLLERCGFCREIYEAHEKEMAQARGVAENALRKAHDLAGQMMGPDSHPNLGAIQDWCCIGLGEYPGPQECEEVAATRPRCGLTLPCSVHPAPAAQDPVFPARLLGQEETCVACGTPKSRGYMCSVCFGRKV